MYNCRVKIKPDANQSWYEAAAFYLYMGDVDRYRGACREMLDRFEKLAEEKPEIAADTAWACALMPDSVPDFSRVERLAERSLVGTEKHPSRFDFIRIKASNRLPRARTCSIMAHLEAATVSPSVSIPYPLTGDRGSRCPSAEYEH